MAAYRAQVSRNIPMAFSHLLFVPPALLLLLVSTLLPGCAGLRVTLSVPPYASLGDVVAMGCQFDVGSSSLYSVKWYKDGDEFCRYMPAYHPQSVLFPVKGIVMDEKGCQMTSVTLKNARIDTTGSYRCEVSTESPNFETNFRTDNLTVRALPNRPPQIRGLQPAYEPGEWVVATCIAGRSLPAATLEWLLNGKPVEDKSWVTGSVIKTSPEDNEEVWSVDEDEDDFDPDPDPAEIQQPASDDGDTVNLYKSRSTLRFQARASQFVGPTHELVLRCEARVHEKSWRTEGKAAMAGPGGKQHLLSHIELQHNMAGAIATPSLLLVLLLRTAAMLVS